MNGENLTERLSKLSPTKRALLDLKIRQNGRSPAEVIIPRRKERDSAPLSFAQQRLWFLNQLEPQDPAYNECSALRLTGELDVEALQRAINHIVMRHEVLRTNFVAVDGNPMQRITDHQTVDIPCIDLRSHDREKRDAEAERLMSASIYRPFDLSRDLMLRPVLLRIEDRQHLLLIVKHHIASDGWSSSIFRSELSALYKAYSAGEIPSLPELSIQYADYAVWQREWLQGDNLESQISYWRSQLAGVSVLNLPTDRPRPVIQSYRGARRSFTLSAELCAQLKGLSRQEGVTLFMTLLAAFQTLLSRYTSQEDISVGTPIAGRTRPETEGLIGFFVNTLVLRTDLSGNPTFRELLARVRQIALDAYDHQDLPFEKLVQEINPDRTLSRSPLFQALLAYQNVPRQSAEIAGLTVTPVDLNRHIAKFDLSFRIWDASDALEGAVEYNTDLYNASTVDRMIGHFQTLLAAAAGDSDQQISELPLLTQTEKHQLLQQSSGTSTGHPQDKTLAQLFEAQVECSPGAVAVIFQGQELSYGELNRRANRLAHRLRSLGVGPDVLVGLCVERSVELVIGILGILKAGGAYVPFDPSYPKERLEFMLEDADVSVMLTQKHLSANLPSHEVAVVYLDGEQLQTSSGAAANEVNLQSAAKPDSLAYVIYTSGSTGRPKGALITHYNVARLFQSTKKWFEFSSSDVWALFHSFAFDFSVWEIWGALLNGGTLVVVPYAVSRSPEEFAALIKENQVTVLNQTPSAFRWLLPYLISNGGAGQSALRYVIFGGEALELQSLQPWFDCYGDETAKLINMYGITETTVHVTYRRITQADLNSGVGSVIGKPIPDLRAYVLDSQQRMQPIGIAGELCVGGAGVASGYLKRPELTAERFIPDPFSSDPQGRLYRSGDLVRWLANGELEYLGRIDGQVKIRGYRIEPGEIEAALNRHAQVRETVVIAREDTPGDRRLVAYFAAENDLGVEELRNQLCAKLPDYMVPSAFVRLNSLPLTSNGKIDRAALPIPEQSRPELGQCYVEPRTQVEETLCGIFGAVLRVEKVGIHDNFFELGGHSLLATQVIARIRRALRVELPLRRLFENPTISGLARNIADERQPSQARQLPPICPASREGDLPLSFAQQRLWFLDQLEPESSAYNVPAVWRLRGPLDVMALQRSIDEIVRRHEVLRTTFISFDGQPMQRILPPMSVSLAFISLAEFPESERELKTQLDAKEEAKKPFDLTHGPLLRAKLIELAKDDHVLLLTMHHIVSDGWSVGVLFRELSLLYEAFAAGELSRLEDLSIQYAEYAVWQRDWLHGDVLETQLSYWRKQLENLSVLNLPTDRPRPKVQSYRGAKARFQLDPTLTKKLWTLSRSENATLYIVLLAAFQIWLSRHSRQEDIAVGSPIAGRSIPEIEGLIGFFANTLVLRGDLSGNPTFREFLRRVREVALEAYAHQDLPFEKLVEDLSPRRDLNISPLFQVMLVLQNDPREDLKLTGLTVSPVRFDNETAKFDLLLSLRENKHGMAGTLEYDTDLFDAPTIDRMLGQFKTLLSGIVFNPDQRIRQLPLQNDAGHHRVIVEWNDTTKEYPRHLCVQELIEIQAEQSPDDIALVFEDRQMTYGELNRRSNQLAHYLKKHGVGTETVVGLSLERSPEMIVGLLGVLKSGGAYLPLDPSYPAERLRLMLEQTGSALILTQGSLVSRLPPDKTARYCLDSLDQVLAQENPESLGRTSSPGNAAYVLFTSGSTGVPKGVLMEHRPLVNLLSWQSENSTLGRGARTLQFASLSFDVSFQEIFSTLCSGGTLVMIDEAARRDPDALLRLLKEKAVERIFLPFVALQQLSEAVRHDDSAPESLREVVTAGEQLQTTPPIAELFARLPQCRLYNQYGPTESHVVTSFALGSDPTNWPNLPPIGRPIANSKIYILDSDLQPLPIGVTGELYIGGDGLARGYLNDHELTQEKFIANPFTKEPGARLYKTGDVARYLADGNIEFSGRIDNQVKVRGFRIEPGEIESLLCAHAEVLKCAVLAREDTPGEKRLVAYVVAGAAQHVTSQHLRDFLQEKLPEYMIPNVFVFVDSLPLTPNRKVDRRALPAPDGRRPELAEAFAAPRTPVEELLAKIWVEVLKLERVGIHDNFFALGGHSLLATQAVSRMREALRIDLPLRNLFEAPTVSELARSIEKSHGKQAAIHGPAIVRVARDSYKVKLDP